ncbi:LppM family (lipo)protein [Euzebya pacifica]|uniref:LppM family (lipo)protein n=1 Tax=Euzebya pacifica TaxID=1608957 RepID=UPI0030F70BAD
MTNLPAAPRRWLLPLIALLVLSTACTVRFQTDVVLSEDNTATLDLIIGVRFEGDWPAEASEVAEDMDPEEAASDIRALADQCGFSEDAVTAGEYTEDDFMGVQITLTSVPVESINCFLGQDPDSPFEEFSIVRDGDDFVFNGTIDLNQAVAGSGLGQKRQVAQAEVAQDTPEEIQQQVDEAFSELEQQLEGLPTDFPTDFPEDFASELEDFGSEFEQGFEDALGGAAPEFEATVSVTFPGEVSEHNAETIDGNTVTWNLSVDSPTTMMAVGSATEGGGSGSLLFIIIGVVVLLLILLGLFLFLRSRGKKKAAAPAFGGPPGAGYGAPGQPGPQGGFGAPPGAPQQPQGGFGGPPGAPQQPQGGYAGPPAAPQQGGFGVPGQAPSAGGFGVPGQGSPQPGGYGNPPGQPALPQQPYPQQPQAPQQPQPPEPQPPQGDQPGGGGFDPGSTRTFRPEDLLPPEDPNNR